MTAKAIYSHVTASNYNINFQNIKIDMYEEIEASCSVSKPVCENSNLEIKVDIKKGNPTFYEVVFDDSNIPNVEFTEFDNGNNSVIIVPIPEKLDYGNYKGKVRFKNSCDQKSEYIDFGFDVYYTKDVVKTKFPDIVYVRNTNYDFVAYQWLKDGVELPNANNQFYSDYPQLNGIYSVILTLKDGTKVETCPAAIDNTNLSKSTNRSVSCYPNPASPYENVSIELQGFMDEDFNKTEIFIFNNLGILVEKLSNIEKINTISLPEGSYLGTVTLEKIKLTFKLIVK